jgi:hypothetical protein
MDSQTIPQLEPLTKQEKYTLDLKDIAKNLKQQFKTEFPGCVFSVSIERYSGGQALHVSLMESDIKVIQDFDRISEIAILRQVNHNSYTIEQLKEMQGKKYHQINEYSLRDDYDPDRWNNGVFLTVEGYTLLKRVCELINHYNFDESEPQTDYFCVNFYTHLNIGKWNKEYIYTGGN